MVTEAKLQDREEQPYAGIRTRAQMKDLPTVIPQLHREVLDWLGRQGVAPAGAPFIRYHVIDMESGLDVELGWPVAAPVAGDGRVSAGVLPAGRYAALVYTGVENGLQANKALLDWAAREGLVWDTYASARGEGFGARLESFLTDPKEEPDPAEWETEVAIRLAA